MTAPVLAATAWPTNGHLIEACAALGYLRADMLTLDATYGRGVWWRRWRPDRLVPCDLHPKRGLVALTDFRRLPFADRTFDAVAFDPPYVCAGGRRTTSIAEFHQRCGMDIAPTTARGVQQLINDGLTEVARVARGVVLVKCQDYVSSASLWPGTHLTLTHALSLGLRLVDRLEHIGKPRPQPRRTRADGTVCAQQHARRNLSTLFVFRKPR